MKLVLEGLGFQEGAKAKEGLTQADMAAARKVLTRKAAAMWIYGTPRTTLLHLMHGMIPTGPPCRTPPRNLRAEEAEFVDEQLANEVESGQLERGNSPWASAPRSARRTSPRINANGSG